MNIRQLKENELFYMWPAKSTFPTTTSYIQIYISLKHPLIHYNTGIPVELSKNEHKCCHI